MGNFESIVASFSYKEAYSLSISSFEALSIVFTHFQFSKKEISPFTSLNFNPHIFKKVVFSTDRIGDTMQSLDNLNYNTRWDRCILSTVSYPLRENINHIIEEHFQIFKLVKWINLKTCILHVFLTKNPIILSKSSSKWAKVSSCFQTSLKSGKMPICSSNDHSKAQKTSESVDPLTPLTLIYDSVTLPIMCKCINRKSSRTSTH